MPLRRKNLARGSSICSCAAQVDQSARHRLIRAKRLQMQARLDSLVNQRWSAQIAHDGQSDPQSNTLQQLRANPTGSLTFNLDDPLDWNVGVYWLAYAIRLQARAVAHAAARVDDSSAPVPGMPLSRDTLAMIGGRDRPRTALDSSPLRCYREDST